MINLIKKDIKACFKTDIKTMAKLIIGILIFSFILFPISAVTIPIFISYILVFRSFYLDELNKSDYFFCSMPIDKEDIVYSKYIFSIIIIIGSLIFMCLYSNIIKLVWYLNVLNIDGVLITLNILLLLVSVCIPLMFKYGYNKSYIIVNLVTISIVAITLFSKFKPVQVWGEDVSNKLITNPKLYILTGICMVIYLISMYISKKIYMKKEIAN